MVLLEHVYQENHSETFENITEEEQTIRRADVEEIYLAYVLLRQSGRQHVKLRSEIHKNYNTEYYRYPKTQNNTLHLLT